MATRLVAAVQKCTVVFGWSRRPLVPVHGRRAAPRDSTGWAAGGEGVLEGGVREK